MNKIDKTNKNVFELFKTHFKEYYDLMKSVSHAYNNDNENYPNKYHLENTVYEHTKMVHDYCVNNYKGKLLDDEYFLLEWMCILHDIGKTICYKDDDDKKHRYFSNHFNFSYYITLDMLLLPKEVKEELGLSDIDIKLIAQTVLNHHVRYDNTEIFIDNTEVLNYLNYLNDCDINGRIFIEEHDKLKTMKLGVLKTINKKLPSITFLIGPPCSGKSSYLRYKNEHNVLSRDVILLEFAKTDNYNDAWNCVDQEVVNELLNKKYNELIKDGKDFFIDMTNMNKKSRKKFHNKGFNSKAIVFEVGYKELLDRNEKRSENDNKNIPESVIYHMVKSLNVKYRDEFNEIEFVRV